MIRLSRAGASDSGTKDPSLTSTKMPCSRRGLWLDQLPLGISRKRMSLLAIAPSSVMTAMSTTCIDLGRPIFEMRGRTKVRCDDEIAGTKRSRDQFDRVVVFQRRAQQGVDQSGQRYAVVQHDPCDVVAIDLP